MTLDELKAMKFKYFFGETGECGAIRVHRSDDGRFERIVRTPKRRGEWGDGVVTYAIAGKKQEYKTPKEMLDAFNEVTHD